MVIDTIIIVVTAVFSYGATLLVTRYLQKRTEVVKLESHALSALMSIISMLISIIVTSHFNIEKKIIQIEKTFGAITNSQAQSLFHKIFESYYANFDRAEQGPMLKTWAHEALSYLGEDMKESAISLPHKWAETLLLNIYSNANQYVVSTHVGSLEKYEKNAKYQLAEKSAMEKGIPVIRFYLFDGILLMKEPLANNGLPVMDEHGRPVSEEYIQMEQDGPSRKEVTFDRYIEQVRTLHNKMPTVMSIVMSTSQLKGYEKRNLVMADGKVVAETANDGTMIRITGNNRKLREAQYYLRELLGSTGKTNQHHYMRDGDIEKRFIRFIRAIEANKERGKPKAKALAEHLLNQTLPE
ncbi:MAG: hypothetical protein OXI22_19435 [Defluviicoccus sp.]|nr:hypothetical protein [Defluviicoccus sp.]